MSTSMAEGTSPEHSRRSRKISDNDEEEIRRASSEEKLDSATVSDSEEESEEMEKIREFFAQKLRLGSPPPKVLETVDFAGIISYISSGSCENIVTMAGAGISTSAGIPDFRSPGSGLYDNLAQYDLPRPEAVFDIDFFRQNPRPFFALARELYPSELRPTPCHNFVRLLEEKGLLLRHYTQNIDTLERAAHISGEKIVEAHGTFHSSHCTGCGREYDQQWMKDRIFSEDVPHCESCKEVVKPDIVFFGENLPSRFFSLVQDDLKKCDLLIILGTSLQVQPFASLVDRVSAKCPRLLINKVKCGRPSILQRMMGMSGLEFDSSANYRDVLWLGTCDDGARAMAAALGWQDELKALETKHKKDSADEE